MITFEPGVSVSKLVVPNKVTFPPLASHLYSSTSTARVPFESIEKCVTHAQFPDGKLVLLGSPESVAYVAINVLVFPEMLSVTVCWAPPVPIGDHCL